METRQCCYKFALIKCIYIYLNTLPTILASDQTFSQGPQVKSHSAKQGIYKQRRKGEALKNYFHNQKNVTFPPNHT